ncbi:MAG: response regulator [Chloroflexi bacterium]|nr:MAG: response regulator [Chloroflexota bacterium]
MPNVPRRPARARRPPAGAVTPNGGAESPDYGALFEAASEHRRSERFLDSIIENLPDMVFVKDAESLRFVRFNRAGEELLGHTRDELIGKNDYDFFPSDEADFFVTKDRMVLEGRDVVDIPEEPIDTAHLGRRILHTKKIPIFDETGRPIYLLGISEDITERKEVDDALRAAREEADRANRAKSSFLSRMSHELRTPLNAILGFSQLLEMDELTDEQRESVGYISRAGRHLLELINEVLDISRIESGQMTISPEPVSVRDVLDELIPLVRPLADRREISVAAIDETGSSFVHADRQRMKQVVLNLLSNAVKYNREGGSIIVRAVVAGPDRVRVSVTDSGYGIAAEHQARLFQPFDRLGEELGSVEGTGMGLALSKGLIEAMGGTIGMDSSLDVGSTFWVELGRVDGPLEQLERAAARPLSLADHRHRRRVLLQIDDNLSNVQLMERIVGHRPGLELVAAMTGRLGIDLAREHRPDVVLLDLHLPDMTGHEVLRLLKSFPETRDLPVIVLSADVTKTKVARLMDAGAFGYLTKPVDVDELLRIVDKAVRDQRAAS